ncbi:MAG: GFA family protein [Pseudomonadota bacterium]
MSQKFTGGCLCGAIRYETTAAPIESYLCHCRICQRHTGSAFWAGVRFPMEGFRYTNGMPSYFNSSPLIRRGFCIACGSTLEVSYVDPPWDDYEQGYEMALGSLDDPGELTPSYHFGAESMWDWVHFDGAIPRQRCDEDMDLQAALSDADFKSRTP